MTTLTRNQKRVYGPIPYYRGTIKATVRYDDECSNGYNTFSITASILDGVVGWSGGCQHDDVAKAFPELAPFIKFHLVSSSEPMHYIANTLYWLGFSGWCDGKETSPPNLEHARASAVWPDMPESMLCTTTARGDGGQVESWEQRDEVKRILTERLESVQREFRAAVESLGFVW